VVVLAERLQMLAEMVGQAVVAVANKALVVQELLVQSKETTVAHIMLQMAQALAVVEQVQQVAMVQELIQTVKVVQVVMV
jgi:hypothetical protein